jgi:UDP-2-acetamido-2,6-beta-L-arabino-hexul-4-ose reductase
MLSSSIQAALDNPYGESKRAGEQLMFNYAKETGAQVFVYRFPNIFGKWCRPNYNSAVATFCHNIAHDLPIQVNNPSTLLHLVYIDDVVKELLDALEGKAHDKGDYYEVPVVHDVTLGEIVDLLGKFHAQPATLVLPEIPADSFAKKLYSTYQSYLPKEKIPIPLKMIMDARGSFTELMKTKNSGQFSINISKPGITKGQHWHHSKWEMFIVVSGHALIQERKIGTDEVIEYEVSGEKMEAYQMLPGYTHNLINLSDTEDLVTIVWANESFDPEHPDTFYEKV